MKKELSEATLIRASQKRSQAGAENLYDRYAQILFKVIFCSVDDPALVELALEQTLYQIWNDIHDFDANNSTLLIWRAGIARARSKRILLYFRNPLLTRHDHETAKLHPVLPRF